MSRFGLKHILTLVVIGVPLLSYAQMDLPRSLPTKKTISYPTEPQRHISSIKTFKAGIHYLKQNCTVKEKPSLNSRSVHTFKAKQQVWAAPYSKTWATVSTQRGMHYIYRSCF